ncbi:MAG: hypothetical protein B6244_06525 [Candidatus Cloacimonetes bacterium 4572_55]|nr:MAG: hypothetical protein B6244_06525 [Candidatus Cloacimonetes bacterium 4572_55]
MRFIELIIKIKIPIFILLLTAFAVFAPGNISAQSSIRLGTLEVPDQFIADLNVRATITVYVEDPNTGGPWGGVGVRVISDRNVGDQVDFFDPESQETNGQGFAYFTIRSDSAGTAFVTAINQNTQGPVTSDKPITFMELSQDNSFITVNPNSAEANGEEFVTVTTYFRDGNDMPIPNVPFEPLSVLVNPSAGTNINVNGVPSDEQGRVFARLTSTEIGVKSVVSVWYNLTLGSGTVTFTPGPVDGEASSVVADPSAVTADSVSVVTVTITVRDQDGNPKQGISGADIDVQVLFIDGPVGGGGDQVAGPSGQTDANGRIIAEVTSKRVGYKQILVTVTEDGNQIQLSQRPDVRFDSGPPDIIASQVSVTPEYLAADGVEEAAVAIQILDHFNNPPFPNPIQTEGAVIISATGSNNYYTQPAGPTDALGNISGMVRSTHAEEKRILVTVYSNLLEDQPHVTFLAGEPDPTTTTIQATPVIIGTGADTCHVTITLRDAFDNLVPNFPDPTQNENVIFWVMPLDGVLITHQLSGVSNEYGQIFGDFVTTVTGIDTVRGEMVLHGQPGTWAIQDYALVNVIPDVTNSGTSIVSATPDIVVADNEEICTIYIQLNDSQNNPVSNVPADSIDIDISGMNNFMVLLGGETNENGEIWTTFRSTRAEVKVINVSVHQGLTVPVSLTPDSVRFVPGALDSAHSSVLAFPTQVVADGIDSSTVTIIARDRFDNTIPGIPQGRITVDVDGGAVVNGPISGTDEQGTALAFVTSLIVGVKTVTVSIQEVGSVPVQLEDRPQITFVPGGIDPETSTLTATSPHVVGPNDPSTITLTLRDLYGNPIVGYEPGFIRIYSDNDMIGDFPPVGVTNENGKTFAYITHVVADTVIFIARVTDSGTGQQHVIQDSLGVPARTIFLPGPPSGERCDLSPAQQEVIVGNFAELTLTVRDTFMNPIPNIPASFILFHVTGTDNHPSDDPVALGPTDENGVTHVRFWSTKAESKTVTASVVDIPIIDEAVVNYRPGSIHDDNSVVQVNPDEVIADGISSSLITITLRDTFHNPIPYIDQNEFDIYLDRLDEQGCTNCELEGFTPGESGTDGIIRNALVSWFPEAIRVTVRVRGVTLADQPWVVFTANTISGMLTEIEADPQVVVADSSQFTTILITARNVEGRPIPGVQADAIDLNVTGERNALGVWSAGATDQQGEIWRTLVSSKAEQKVITATISGVVVDDNEVVTFVPGPVDHQRSWMTATTPKIANGVDYSLVTMQFNDAFNNPISVFGSGSDSLYIKAMEPDTAGVTIFQPTLPANESAQVFARVTSVVQHSGDQAVELRAFLNNQSIALPQLVEFIYEIDPLRSTVRIEPNRDIYADNSDSAVVYVDIRSSTNAPIPNIPITIESSRNTFEDDPTDHITPPGATNANGSAKGYVRSEHEGASFLTVKAVAITDSVITLADMMYVEFARAPLARFDSDSLYAEPNPFIPDSPHEDYNQVRFNIPLRQHTGGDVYVEVYDIGGALVKKMPAEFDGNRGSYSAYWDGTDTNSDPVAGGIYIYQVNVSGTEILHSIVGLAR